MMNLHEKFCDVWYKLATEGHGANIESHRGEYKIRCGSLHLCGSLVRQTKVMKVFS